jgi:hypothetical protein
MVNNLITSLKENIRRHNAKQSYKEQYNTKINDDKAYNN